MKAVGWKDEEEPVDDGAKAKVAGVNIVEDPVKTVDEEDEGAKALPEDEEEEEEEVKAVEVGANDGLKKAPEVKVVDEGGTVLVKTGCDDLDFPLSCADDGTVELKTKDGGESLEKGWLLDDSAKSVVESRLARNGLELEVFFRCT